MPKEFDIKVNREAWNALVKDVITNEGVPRMKRVADACNGDAGLGDGGYMVSVEGDKPLTKHDYRATVITATADAAYDNAKNNTLVKNFHLAGGA